MEGVTGSQPVSGIASDAESKSPLVLSISITTIYATNSIEEAPLAVAEPPQNVSDGSGESGELDGSDESDESDGSEGSEGSDGSISKRNVDVLVKKPKARIAREYFKDNKSWWIDELE